MENIKSIARVFGINSRPTVTPDNYLERLYFGPDKSGLEYLQKARGFVNSVIQHFKLGLDEYGDIAIPIFKSGQLIDYKYRGIKEKTFRRHEGSENWVLNEVAFDTCTDQGYIICVEGEFDAIALWQLGFKNVVSTTGGAQGGTPWVRNVPEQVKVYINYDNDEPGQEAARKLADKLGIQRCYNVILTCKDANDFMLGGGTHDQYQEILNKSERFKIQNVYKISEVIDNLEKNKLPRVPVFSEMVTKCMNGGIPSQSLVVISGDTGVGKCFGKGTKILMHDGSVKNVEHIVKGDVIMGDDSTPRNILSTTKGIDTLYRVKSVKGDEYIVNSQHILSLKSTNAPKRNLRKGIIVNISVLEYLNRGRIFKHLHKGWRTGVEFEEKELPIEPYFMGLWLGDGNSGDPRITTMDDEIKDYLRDHAIKIGLSYHERTKSGTEAVGISTSDDKKGLNKNTISYRLRKLGVLNNKHIPDIYKVNSRKNRLSLLAGLIDSDGSLGHNCFGITQKNNRLTEDILYLCRSLGLAAYSKKVRKSIKSIGFTGTYNNITITGEIADVPTILKRKQAHKRIQKKDVLVSAINVSEIGNGDYYGFEIDGNKLFLLSDFTVVHNSTILTNFLNYHAGVQKKPVLLISLENDIYFTVQRILEIKLEKPYAQFTKEDWIKVRTDMLDYPFYIDTSMETYSLDRLEKIIDQAKKLYDIEFLGFDHIGFLPTRDDPKEISQMMRGLKLISRNNRIITYVVSHINRDKDDGYPTLKRLKGSSSIEQDSDIVMFVVPTEAGHEVSIDKARMSPRYFRVPIYFNGDTGVMKDDYSRSISRNGEVIPNDPIMPKIQQDIAPEDKSIDY